jgi:hypothetical protein
VNYRDDKADYDDGPHRHGCADSNLPVSVARVRLARRAIAAKVNAMTVPVT